MSWYNDPYRHPLPYEYAALDNSHSHTAHTLGVSLTAPRQYAQQFAPTPNLPHFWAQNYNAAHSAMVGSAENVAPITNVQRGPAASNPKRRKYDQTPDTAVYNTHTGQDNLQTYQRAVPQQSSRTVPLGLAWDQQIPEQYRPSPWAYAPHQPRSAAPAGLPPLPGATQYENRQRNDKSHVKMAAQPRAPNTSPPRSSQVEKRPLTDHQSRSQPLQAKRPKIERHVDNFEASMGTQHHPLEIASSPERAQKPKSSKKKKKKFYAVAIGYTPGIFTDWSVAEGNIKGFPGAKHRSFPSEAEARQWLEEVQGQTRSTRPSEQRKPNYRANIPSSSPPPYEEAYPRAWHRPTDIEDPRSWNPVIKAFDPTSRTLSAGDPSRNDPSIDPDSILKPEQQKVVDLILQGHNVFYTGSAGCGKSTILKAFVKQLTSQGKRVKIVAPTNLAALNVGGTTTWSFAGWTPDSMKKPLEKLMAEAHGQETWKRFDSTDVLVIDEISMVENLLFERLSQIMTASRGGRYGDGPFGNVQVIVTGDFCQLSPVKPFQHCIGCGWELVRDNQRQPKEYQCENRRCREDVFYDIDKWAFRSKAWEGCKFKHINLTEIHRQSDRKFISILQKIRTDGIILKPHANILLNHTSETEGAIQLFARRDDVDRINNDNIAKLPAQAITYKCVDHFDWKTHHREEASLEKNTRRKDDGTLVALKDHRYEVSVHLKQGQRVVLQANLEPASGLVNGSQGTIIEFEPFDEKRLPRKAENKMDAAPMGTSFTRGTHARYNEEQIKDFGKENKRQPWPVVRFDNGTTRTIFADCTANELGNEEPYSLLSRTQIPLMAGYAVTVHKSQGMTLERVIVDLSRAFEPSQIYVALSRARSLKGLKVMGLPRVNLGGANEQVKEFFDKYLRSPPPSLS